MNTTVYSKVTNKKYDVKKCVRLLNVQQVGFYLTKGAEILDVYPSTDYNTGRTLVVFLFDREATTPLYQEWCDNKDFNENRN